MNTADIIILAAVILPGIITGVKRGFIHQALSIVAIWVGALLAGKFTPDVCKLLSGLDSIPENARRVLAFVLIFIASYILLFMLASLIEKVLKSLNAGFLDKLLGVIFGVAKLSLVAGLICVVLNSVNAKTGIIPQETLDSSVLYKALGDFTESIIPYLKMFIGKAV